MEIIIMSWLTGLILGIGIGGLIANQLNKNN